jgi:phosphatidylglycerophosphate synthase
MPDLSARRPLKTRSSRWAAGLSRALLAMGLRPNFISVMSVIFAAVAATSLFILPSAYLPPPLLWIIAAAGVQLRLLCNLMDGMLAVEGGLKTPNGDLYNEFPDRISDVLILASLGFAVGDEWSRTLGWLCACGALTTASIRMHGASLLGTHDYRGPMAKQQRMAVVTLTCLIMAGLDSIHLTINPLPWILGGMLAGIIITMIRRLGYLSKALKDRAENPNAKP